MASMQQGKEILASPIFGLNMKSLNINTGIGRILHQNARLEKRILSQLQAGEKALTEKASEKLARKNESATANQP